MLGRVRGRARERAKRYLPATQRTAQAAAAAAHEAAEAADTTRRELERLAAEMRELREKLTERDLAAGHRIVLDYPVTPRSRFGHGQPTHLQLHEIISANQARYRERLDQILAVVDDLHRLPITEPADPTEPFWANPWLPGLDVAALYAFLVHHDPALYLEVGSGTSTKVARRAIGDHHLRTRIVSIDPHPRAEIDALCDEVIRSPLEDCDLAVFDRVQAGDVVFIDNSHRVFTNSDVTVVFWEVLPRLATGTLIHLHDIFLPDDYPPDWAQRYYSEQYVLAALLLGGARTVHTELPCWYVATHQELAERLWPLFVPLGDDVQRHGNSYWFTTARPQ